MEGSVVNLPEANKSKLEALVNPDSLVKKALPGSARSAILSGPIDCLNDRQSPFFSLLD